MADSKITALTSIGTSTDPANDPLVIVDVSDTSMAATGTTKKVTLNNLLACSPTATLASATISGNLTLSAGTVNGVGYLNASKVLTAGSALVFDGTNLGVGGTGQLRFATSGGAIGDNSIGTENSFSMMLRCGRGSTSNIEIASDKLVFGVAATEQMRLNATGLGVGQPATTSKLEVGIINTSTAGLIEANALKIENSNATVNNAAGLFLSQSGTAGCGIAAIATSRTAGSRTSDLVLYYYNQATSASPVEGLRLTASGNVGIGVAPSAGKGCLQLSSGINFPATQVASSDANTLDDYEEGTFTPTIVGTSAAGTGTYTVQTAQYTKIGKQVTVQLYLAWTAHTGTGNMVIGGLPFTTLNVGTAISAAALGFVDLIALTAGNIMTAYSPPNNTQIVLKQTPTGGGASTDVPIDTSGSIILTLTYIANT